MEGFHDVIPRSVLAATDGGDEEDENPLVYLAKHEAAKKRRRADRLEQSAQAKAKAKKLTTTTSADMDDDGDGEGGGEGVDIDDEVAAAVEETAEAAAAEAVAIRAIDLELLVSGVPMVDADDWRKHCQGSVVEYLSGLKSPPPPLPAAASDEQKRDYKIRVKLYECRGLAKWFWEVVEEMGMTERAKVRVGVDCERRE